MKVGLSCKTVILLLLSCLISSKL